MTEDQINFFIKEIPCPESIPNCGNLREEYFSELEKYKQNGGCSSCIERSLRNKYITFILSTTPNNQ
jgi:hypothetical protein